MISFRVVNEFGRPQPDNQFSIAQKEPSDQRPALGQERETEIQQILTRNLFNEPAMDAQPNHVNASPPVQTQPSLGRFQLVGTIAGAGNKSIAILKDRSLNHQVIVALGDAVEGLGVIRFIDAKRIEVILNDTGKSIWLEVGQADSTAALEVQLLPAGPDRWVLRRSDLELLATKPDLAFSAITFEPRYLGDKVAGYEVVKVRENSLPFRMGLRQGDLVTEINARPINRFEQILEMYSNLQQFDELTIAIVRAGKKHNLRYEIH